MVTVSTALRQDYYEFCYPIGGGFRNIAHKMNGAPLLKTWKPIPMEIIHEDEGRPLLESDSPWLGSHALIFRPRALEILGPLLRESGELLPLSCDEAEVWLFNATRVVDALDEAASSFVRSKAGKIIWIKRYSFKPEVIRGMDIFKIASLQGSPVFLGERFVGQWTTAGLRGLEFTKVWAEY